MTPPHARAPIGNLLLGIALLHTLVGVAAGVGLIPPRAGAAPSAPLLDIARDGVFDAVESSPERMAIAWFLFAGLALGLAGQLQRDAERAGLRPSRGLAISLGAFCLLGVIAIPVSGFWLGFVPAWLAWRASGPQGTLGTATLTSTTSRAAPDGTPKMS